MKYVKTKDGKIVKVNLEGDVFTSRYEIVGEPKDTIEELCDEFVDVYKDKRKKERIVIHAKRFVKWQVDLKKYNVYGAVWTDKGLIYVAKMNSEGKLELI